MLISSIIARTATVSILLRSPFQEDLESTMAKISFQMDEAGLPATPHSYTRMWLTYLSRAPGSLSMVIAWVLATCEGP